MGRNRHPTSVLISAFIFIYLYFSVDGAIQKNNNKTTPTTKPPTKKPGKDPTGLLNNGKLAEVINATVSNKLSQSPLAVSLTTKKPIQKITTATSGSTEKPAQKQEKAVGSSPSTSLSCGDTLKSPTGRITYKIFELVGENERCVWVLRYPKATSYQIILESLGRPSSVIISGLYYGSSLVSNVPTGPTILSLNVSVIIITFYSGPNSSGNSRGFLLSFNASTTGPHQRISETSEDISVPAGYGHIKYPSDRDQYDNYEYSTFIISPVLGADKVFKNTNLIYIRDKIEAGSGGCADFLTVYDFNTDHNGISKWVKLGMICAGVDSQVITSRDLILITFQSNEMNTYSGFHMYAYANN